MIHQIHSLWKRWRTFVRDRRGGSTIEYVMILAAALALSLVLYGVLTSGYTKGIITSKVASILNGTDTGIAPSGGGGGEPGNHGQPPKPKPPSSHQPPKKQPPKKEESGWDKFKRSLVEEYNKDKQIVEEKIEGLKQGLQNLIHDPIGSAKKLAKGTVDYVKDNVHQLTHDPLGWVYEASGAKDLKTAWDGVDPDTGEKLSMAQRLGRAIQGFPGFGKGAKFGKAGLNAISEIGCNKGKGKGGGAACKHAGPTHDKKDSSLGNGNYIEYNSERDQHGWLTPKKPPTKEQLAKQTEGLSTLAENEREKLKNELIERVGLEEDKDARKKLKAMGYSNSEIRKILQLRYKMMKSSNNIATAKVEIQGVDLHELKAYSGKNVPGFDEGWVKEQDKPSFEYVKAKEGEESVSSIDREGETEEIGHERYNDTEAKILELVSAKLGYDNPGKKGDKIILYTERKTCPGCQGQNRQYINPDGSTRDDPYYGVIDQFSKRHPNIEVIVYDGEGRKLVLMGGKPVTQP
ncbi:DUF4244 domain-containing protein [Polycladomyces sp. WAk]|uniref:DUF4244 domain-containing protein n=1 Tax=Polycladomyces zharkentensis TaxID=2807616 RepID=A0ABS2WM13_9BACL|nr:DUF4244 domain-containing protein [Polycladomyces sp. WAk]MBN2910564.1 DUF4244 domain-containing protein [Polycladomyces sp. WAk]